MVRGQGYAGAANAEHLRHELLRERKYVPSHEVACPQQPSAKAFLYVVRGIASSRLLRLREQQLILLVEFES